MGAMRAASTSPMRKTDAHHQQDSWGLIFAWSADRAV